MLLREYPNYLHILKALVKDVQDGQLNLQAMSLAYITFLSLVPLLAFSFSILQAFGVHNLMEPMLQELLEPLGDQGIVITNRIVEFVGNMKVRAIGAFGFLILILTIISLTRKVEEAFNFTWRVKNNRNFLERFSHYLSVIVVGPVLMFSALGLSAAFLDTDFMQSLSNSSSLGALFTEISKHVPKLLIISAFSFTYWFIPNTKVKLKYALIGGIIAGSIWQLAGWAFASYVAHSSQQTAIYSVFAGLFFFFIWMYVGWIILLIGSSIACYLQHPEYARYRFHHLTLAGKDQQKLAIALMQSITKRHYDQRPPYTIDDLQQEFKIPLPVLNETIELLIYHGILTMDQAEPPRYIPLRPLSKVSVQDVIDAVQTGSEAQIQSAQEMLDSLIAPSSNSNIQQSFKELMNK